MSPTLFKADLHCHSTCSDGVDTPQALLELAVSLGLTGLSITDHDTVDAYAQLDLKKLPIPLLPGCELSTGHEGHTVHLLAYGFNPADPLMQQLCLDQQKRRVDRNRAMLELLRGYKMPVAEDEVIGLAHGAAAWGRPHMAQAMVAHGYVRSVRDAFQIYLGENKLCYVSGSRPATDEMIETLHRMRVLVVLAHPHLLPSGNNWTHRLLQLPWDGVEARYANYDASDARRWLKMAEKRGWFVTGGSDYHGSIKPHGRLGSSCTESEVFQLLLQRYEESLRTTAD